MPVSLRKIQELIVTKCPAVLRQCGLDRLLSSQQCQRHFVVLHGPAHSIPHLMISNIRTMLSQYHMFEIQHILAEIHSVQLHPKDNDFPLEAAQFPMYGSCLDSSHYVPPEAERSMNLLPSAPVTPQKQVQSVLVQGCTSVLEVRAKRNHLVYISASLFPLVSLHPIQFSIAGCLPSKVCPRNICRLCLQHYLQSDALLCNHSVGSHLPTWRRHGSLLRPFCQPTLFARWPRNRRGLG